VKTFGQKGRFRPRHAGSNPRIREVGLGHQSVGWVLNLRVPSAHAHLTRGVKNPPYALRLSASSAVECYSRNELGRGTKEARSDRWEVTSKDHAGGREAANFPSTAASDVSFGVRRSRGIEPALPAFQSLDPDS